MDGHLVSFVQGALDAFEFRHGGGSGGKGDEAVLFINDKKVGKKRIERTVAGRFGIDTFRVSCDTGAPLCNACKPTFALKGEIEKLHILLGDPGLSEDEERVMQGAIPRRHQLLRPRYEHDAEIGRARFHHRLKLHVIASAGHRVHTRTKVPLLPALRPDCGHRGPKSSSINCHHQTGRCDMKRLTIFIALSFLAGTAHPQAGKTVPVTIDNFVRAESDMYLGNFVKEAGGLGKLSHRREVAAIDNQTVIRLNRDTLYSSAVFDLDAGPVTVTLPDAGKRFRSMMVVNQDHYVPAVYYKPGAHTLTRQQVGTRYVAVAIRTLVDPNDPKDLKEVHALQDAIKVSQKASGTFEVPNWDHGSQKKVREALLVLAATKQGFRRAFGTRQDVDPVAHLLGSAAGWGGNPDRDAVYEAAAPAKNDGTTVHRLVVKDVPVDAFWSISVYNEQGYFEKNALDAYSINNLTAKKNADGSVAVQFGGCDGKVPNCLPIVKGWNYTVRLYRPRAEILDGKWKFPEPEPAS